MTKNLMLLLIPAALIAQVTVGTPLVAQSGDTSTLRRGKPTPPISPSAALCKRIRLAAPVHVGIPTWSAAYGHILLPDQPGSRIVTLRADGKATMLESFRATVPFAISKIGDEYLGINDESEVRWLDRNLKPIGKSKIDLREDSAAEIHIGSVLDWSITDNGVLVGLASIRRGDKEPEMALIRKDLSRPGSGVPSPTKRIPVQGLSEEELSWNKAGRISQFYNHFERFFTTVGTTAYFLLLQAEKPPRLFRYDTERDWEAQEVNGFPFTDQKLPSISNLPLALRESILAKERRRTRDRFTVADLTLAHLSPSEFQEFVLDKYSMPRGLVSQNGYLYLLYKSNEVGWLLFQLVTDDEEVVHRKRMPIPSSAQSLTVLPTPQTWFIFERSFEQEEWPVKTMLSIPQRWIEDWISSPFYGRYGNSVLCVLSSPP